MEYENPQSRDETTALEAATQHTDAIAPNSDAKGELLPEIGMGIVGEIIAMGIAFGLCYLYDYTHPCTRGVSCGMGWPHIFYWAGPYCLFCLQFLLLRNACALPECVLEDMQRENAVISEQSLFSPSHPFPLLLGLGRIVHS